MKIIVTGMNGTVAPPLAARLREAGHSIIAWNRSEVPPDDAVAIEDFMNCTQPGVLCHLATGSAEWAEMLARTLARRRARLLYTSSVSIFSAEQRGPFTTDAEPKPADEYGRYKRDCEERILAVNPGAVIARLGWQIGEAAGSNNMVDYLARTNAAQNGIDASANWLPACSFLQDTAVALATLLCDVDTRGIYHLDANPGLSFFEIASRLNDRHGGVWNVWRTTEPHWDQRLIDERIRLAPITERL